MWLLRTLKSIAACVALASLITMTPALSRAAPQRASLCDEGEIAAFSCTTADKKIVSLCTSHNISPRGYVQYRIGRARDAIELSYPPRPLKPSQAFQAYSVEEPYTLQAYVFRIGAYRYTLLYRDSLDAGSVVGGVLVDRAGTAVGAVSCDESTIILDDDAFFSALLFGIQEAATDESSWDLARLKPK